MVSMAAMSTIPVSEAQPLNASLPINSTGSSAEIRVSFPHLMKASRPMLVTAANSHTSKSAQSRAKRCGIDRIPCPSLISRRLAHWVSAGYNVSSRSATPSPNSHLSSAVHPLNVSPCMIRRPSPSMATDFRPVHFAKACELKTPNERPILTASNSVQPKNA